MKIVDVMEKVSTLKNKRHQQIDPKILEGVVPQIQHFVHVPGYKILMWLKMQILPLQPHLFVDKAEN